MNDKTKDIEVGIFITGADGDSVFLTLPEAMKVKDTLNGLFPTESWWPEVTITSSGTGHPSEPNNPF